MPYYSPETIKKVKQIDLLTFLQNYDPDELVPFSRSLKISNGMWYWFSRGIGGRTALEYLIQVKEYSFIEAVKILSDMLDLPITYNLVTKKPPPSTFEIPIKAPNNIKASVYLQCRGINKDIIEECFVV